MSSFYHSKASSYKITQLLGISAIGHKLHYCCMLGFRSDLLMKIVNLSINDGQILSLILCSVILQYTSKMVQKYICDTFKILLIVIIDLTTKSYKYFNNH